MPSNKAQRLSLVIGGESTQHAAPVRAQQTVGQLAREYRATTLELATALDPAWHVGEVGLRAGDRLLLLTQAPHPPTLPLALPSFNLALNGQTVYSDDQPLILLGKPDPEQGLMPHVDLNVWLTPETAGYVSRQCVLFQLYEGRWYARRMGQTRVLLDDYELPAEQAVPLVSDGTPLVMRLQRAEGAPQGAPLLVLVVTLRSPSDAALPLPLLTARETAAHQLNASENLVLGRILTSLADYLNAPWQANAPLYHLRLLPPTQMIGDALAGGGLLYAPQL
jgi:hypothetical protein